VEKTIQDAAKQLMANSEHLHDRKLLRLRNPSDAREFRRTPARESLIADRGEIRMAASSHLTSKTSTADEGDTVGSGARAMDG